MITRLAPTLAIIYRHKLVEITPVNLRTHKKRVAPMLRRLIKRLP